MNPARSLGPAIVDHGHTSALGKVWVFIAGPIIGSLLAVLMTYMFQFLPKTPEKVSTGRGESMEKP